MVLVVGIFVVVVALGIGSYYEGATQPVFIQGQQTCYWYDTWNNYMKYSNDGGATWPNIEVVYMGHFSVENKSAIQPPGYDPTNPSQAIPNSLIPSSIKVFSPIKILTDKDTYSITNYSMPSNVLESIVAPAQGNWAYYWANRSGWFTFVANTENDSIVVSSLGWSIYTTDASKSIGKIKLI